MTMHFESRLARMHAEHDTGWDDMMALQHSYEDALKAEYKRLHPFKRRPPADWRKAQAAIPDIEAFAMPWKERMAVLSDARQARHAEAESELRQMAEALPVPSGDPDTFGLRLCRQVNGRDYRSQGFGANSYARKDALATVDKARAYGLIAEVRTVSTHYVGGQYPWTCETYGVFINTTATGWEILQRKPEIPLREYVRLCWKRGANPRVYLPFLPHGYEEAEGLDYFGGEIRPAKLIKQGRALIAAPLAA